MNKKLYVNFDIGCGLFFGIDLMFPQYGLDSYCYRIGLGFITIRFNWE